MKTKLCLNCRFWDNENITFVKVRRGENIKMSKCKNLKSDYPITKAAEGENCKVYEEKP